MKVEGYIEVNHDKWKEYKGETLHVIHQLGEKDGCRTQEVLYFIKEGVQENEI